jgi:hypothetical protein
MSWFSSGLFPSNFPTNILHAFLFSPTHDTCPVHLILLDLFILITSDQEYKSLSSSLFSFLQPHVTSSLFCANILFSTLSSNTLCLHSSLNVTDKISHPHRTTGKIIVLYILTFMFLDSRQEDKRFWTEWQQATPEFFLIHMKTKLYEANRFGFQLDCTLYSA